MRKFQDLILENVVESMAEGVMVIGFDGVIKYANPAAFYILGFSREDFVGISFASLFFNNSDNDDFSQIVIDSITDRDKEHQSVVRYKKGDGILHLHVRSSFLIDSKERKGIIVVISDLSEIIQTRDAFERFLSGEIVKQLLDTPDGLKLGGKKQVLTMMMSDLRGFTAMSERMDAEDLISMLNHYLGEMTEAIQSYGGTIIEFIGDGILAIFGSPDETEDHAARAVAAALLMQSKMEDVNKWNNEHDYPLLDMGIGINTGEVIVGNIGSEKRTKYGIVGSQVNMCGRIESYTIGGQVLISQSTYDMVKEKLETAKIMTVYPKGANGELVLTHVTGIGEPYNIHVQLKDSVLQLLDNPIAVRFFKIENKRAVTRSFYGGITSVARDAAVLETDAELQIYDNIQINAGGKLFCKVTNKTDNGYELQYTSVPAGYAGWLKDARN